MPVYLIVEVQVENKELYAEYIANVSEIIKKYGGKYLARGGKITPLSGNWHPERIILIEFESIEQVQNCFKSDEYRELMPFREASTLGKAIIVDGYIPSEEG